MLTATNQDTITELKPVYPEIKVSSPAAPQDVAASGKRRARAQLTRFLFAGQPFHTGTWAAQSLLRLGVTDSSCLCHGRISTEYVKVSEPQTIWVARYGNPSGIPAVALHGGPVSLQGALPLGQSCLDRVLTSNAHRRVLALTLPPPGSGTPTGIRS